MSKKPLGAIRKKILQKTRSAITTHNFTPAMPTDMPSKTGQHHAADRFQKENAFKPMEYAQPAINTGAKLRPACS
ncbi:MAG: hypothetical protein V4646_11075 [Pseudomonadota bacterium]